VATCKDSKNGGSMLHAEKYVKIPHTPSNTFFMCSVMEVGRQPRYAVHGVFGIVFYPIYQHCLGTFALMSILVYPPSPSLNIWKLENILLRRSTLIFKISRVHITTQQYFQHNCSRLLG